MKKKLIEKTLEESAKAMSIPTECKMQIMIRENSKVSGFPKGVTSLLKTVLIIGSLFLSITTKAQNPFITRADVMMQFGISANEQLACCSWWGADAISKIRTKDLYTQKVFDVDSVSLKKAVEPFYSESFLSNDQLLFVKEKTLFSYNLNSHNRVKLFDLPEIMVQNLTVTKDKKGIYFNCHRFIYYADFESGIKSKKKINDFAILSLSTTLDNQVIYSISVKEEGKDVIQIWSWDGQDQSINLTEQFSNGIKTPYIVEAISEPNLYIVASREGVFRFDKSTNKATKLIDNPKENPVAEVQMSNDNKTLYYLTFYQRAVIKTVDMDGKQGKSILF